MATTEPAPDTHPPSVEDVAATIRDQLLVQIGVRADAASLAASGILAHACRGAGTAFHVSTVRTVAECEEWRETTDPEAGLLTLGIDENGSQDESLVRVAAATAHRLEVPVPAGLVVAGGLADGYHPSELDAPGVELDGIHQRLGLGIPIDDPVAGLAYSTLIHGPFSGSPEAVGDLLPDDDGADRLGDDEKGVASVVALESLGVDAASTRAAHGLEAVLNPHVGAGPFVTVEGYADVLGVLATSQPGLGVGLALGADIHEAAVGAWQDTAKLAHQGVREADTARYDGVMVAQTSGPVELVARLMRDYRSPEPVVLALNDGIAGIAAAERAAGPLVEAVIEAGIGSGLARDDTGFVRFDDQQTDVVINAVREVA